MPLRRCIIMVALLLRSTSLVLRPAAATAAAAGMRFPTMHRPLHAATSNAVPEGEYTSVSFYKFVAVPDPVEAVVHNVQQHVKSLWKGGDVLGTILIAREGVNAQLVVPAPVVSSLAALLAAADPVFNDITINIGQTIDYSANSHIPFPYKKLVIRAKDQILTDGFACAGTVLDFSDAGPEVPPSQWHAEIGNRDPSSANTIVLDCRNSYESDIGTFQGALPLNTTKFSETWDVLENKLAGVPKTTRVLTFCTGGIRCVKVNAYLKQKLGFTNIGRLENGIVSYERFIANSGAGDGTAQRDTLFVGTNFVFDKRRLSNNDGTDE